MKEGRKPEYPEKTPDDELQKVVSSGLIKMLQVTEFIGVCMYICVGMYICMNMIVSCLPTCAYVAFICTL